MTDVPKRKFKPKAPSTKPKASRAAPELDPEPSREFQQDGQLRQQHASHGPHGGRDKGKSRVFSQDRFMGEVFREGTTGDRSGPSAPYMSRDSTAPVVLSASSSSRAAGAGAVSSPSGEKSTSAGSLEEGQTGGSAAADSSSATSGPTVPKPELQSDEETELADVLPLASDVASLQVEGRTFCSDEHLRPVLLPFKRAQRKLAAVNASSSWQGVAEQDICFIQLPTTLPQVYRKNIVVLPLKATSAPIDPNQPLPPPPAPPRFDGALATMQTGKIGKMRVHKSGKVSLVIGGLAFEMTEGLPCYFRSEIVSISPEQKSMSVLGQINKRFVCVPNFEELCEASEMHHEEATQVKQEVT